MTIKRKDRWGVRHLPYRWSEAERGNGRKGVRWKGRRKKCGRSVRTSEEKKRSFFFQCPLMWPTRRVRLPHDRDLTRLLMITWPAKTLPRVSLAHDCHASTRTWPPCVHSHMTTTRFACTWPPRVHSHMTTTRLLAHDRHAITRIWPPPVHLHMTAMRSLAPDRHAFTCTWPPRVHLHMTASGWITAGRSLK